MDATREANGIPAVADGNGDRLDRLVALAVEALGAGSGFVAVLHDGDVAILAHAGEAPAALSLDDARASPLASGHELRIADTRQDTSEQAGALAAHGIGRYLGIPLSDADGTIVGVFAVLDRQPRRINPAEESLLQASAGLTVRHLAAQEWMAAEPDSVAALQRCGVPSASVDDAVFTVDWAGHLASVNNAFAALTGHTVPELHGTALAQLVADQDRPGLETRLQRAWSGVAQAFPIGLRHRDSSHRQTAMTLALQPQVGQRAELVGTARDVSDAVAAEQRLDLALEASGQGIWEYDGDTARIYRSHHLRHALGCDHAPDWITIDAWQACLHPADRAGFETLITQGVAAADGALGGQWRLDCQCQGHRWFQWHARVLSRYDDGRPALVIGAVADIHELKRAEERRLREAGRMALAVRAGGAGSFELALDGNTLHYDARMHELLGLTEDDDAVTTQGLIARFHPGDQADLRSDLAAVTGGQGNLDRERRVCLDDGEIRHLRLLAERMETTDGSPLLVGTAWDVTEARTLEHELAYQARHDALTGLANRYEFERHLADVQADVDAGTGEAAVGFLDLDRFKIVNDTAGHAAGDDLLRQLGTYLARCIRANDMLARLGGDEFGLIVRHCGSADAQRRLEAIMSGLEGWQFQACDRTFEVSASAGVAALEPGGTVATAMSHADIACYTAKMRGRRNVAVYEAGEGDTGHHHRELQLAADLRAALSAERLTLYGQLIEPCHFGPQESGGFVELLVRMIDEDGELVSPGLFIPAAEHYDLMVAVDRWVIENALLGAWQDLAVNEGVRLSVNLSGQSINDEGFLKFVLDIIDRSSVPPDRINFEITETAVMTHISNARHVVDEVRQRGCTVALDDFGSGLSSFNYLRHFNVDFVKIDGGFVRAMVASEPDRIIVESINDLAHRLGARTIAEFVTDEAVLDSVRAMRVDYAQGFVIGRPEPITSYYGIWPQGDDADQQFMPPT